MPKAVVNGLMTYYEVHGRGEPLVLIPGFGGEHHAWLFQLPAFKRHCQVVVLDSRGTGATARARTPYTIPDLARDIIGLLDWLGLPRAHLLGHSLGGLVAQEAALVYPERIGKLILASTFASVDVLTRHGRPEDFGRRESPAAARAYARRLLDYVVKVAFNKPLYRGVIQLLRLIPTSIDAGSYLDMLQAAQGYSSADSLPLVQAPTLVITGAADRLVPPSNSDFLAGRIPGARLFKLAGGSHSCFMEQSGLFNRAVLDFLRSAG